MHARGWPGTRCRHGYRGAKGLHTHPAFSCLQPVLDSFSNGLPHSRPEFFFVSHDMVAAASSRDSIGAAHRSELAERRRTCGARRRRMDSFFARNRTTTELEAGCSQVWGSHHAIPVRIRPGGVWLFTLRVRRPDYKPGSGVVPVSSGLDLPDRRWPPRCRCGRSVFGLSAPGGEHGSGNAECLHASRLDSGHHFQTGQHTRLDRIRPVFCDYSRRVGCGGEPDTELTVASSFRSCVT